jgi:photosystem II stability/assembly factor-like uncharacterized protein
MKALPRRVRFASGTLALALVAACVGPVSEAVDSVPPDSPHDAAAWRIGRYADENGQIPQQAWQTALMERERTVAATAARPEAGGIASPAWVERGPANVAGRSRILVIDPRDPQRMFAGSVSGGLWRSTDGGANWAHVDDWWGNLSVPTVTLDPSDPDVMYVGTGEGFYSLAHLTRSFSHFVRGAGVMKSTDGGVTWAQLPATASWLHVTRIAVSPTDPNVLLASRRPGGIARSTDGGATWTDVATGEHSFQVVFDPNDGNRAVAHFCATSALTHSVLTSTDAGATWQPAQSGLNAVTGESSRIELCYARSAPGVVYASVGGNGGSVWRSTDNGINWTQRSASGTSTGTSYYYNALWVDPTNENVVVIGALHVWRSTDGGQTFTQTTNGYIMTVDPHLDVHSVVADPGYDGVTNRRVYVTTDGGVHVANNIFAAAPGSGWADLDATMISTQFYAAAGHGSSDLLMGGTQDNGTLRIVGSNRNANLTFGGDGGQVQIDPTDSRYVYGEYQYLGVHRSSNGGASSGTITRGLGDFGSGNSNFIAPLRLDPNNTLRLYAGGRQLWRTTNARASNVGWTAIKPNVGSLTSAIAIAPGLSDRVLVGHNDGRLYRSSNATATSPTWTAVDDNGANDPLPDRVVTRLVFDPSDASVVYATFGGFAADNLWRSGDGGLTWQRITGTAPFALPTAPVYGMTVHPDDPDVLYAATEVGVFASDDGGAHWTTDNDGPASVVAEEITFMHGTRRLVLATLGRGLWTADVRLPGYTSFGTGCGSATPPQLAIDPRAPARIGKTLGLDATGLAAGQPMATLLVGLSDQSWNGTPLPLPLAAVGLPNCQLLCSVDGAVSAAITASGAASWGLPLPDDRNLLGASLYFQVVAPDPGANATGLGMSQGLSTQLGW